MPALRKPTALHELSGAFKHNPDRARPNEPDVALDFDKSPPAHLNAHQQRIWREVVGIIPGGVFSSSDVIHVEMVCVLLAEFREDSGGMQTARIGRLSTEMGKLGLNPSDRAGLTVDKSKANKYADA